MTTQGSGGTTSDKDRAFRAPFEINLAIAVAETCSPLPDWYLGQSNFLDDLAS